MNDVERLKAVIDYFKMNPKQFAESLGFSRPDRVYQVLNQKNKISNKFALEITSKYNNVNYSWLLTGEGEMLKEENLLKEPFEVYEKGCNACKEKDKIIDAQKKTIEAQSKTIEAYENTIELQKQLIESLKSASGNGQKRKAG